MPKKNPKRPEVIHEQDGLDVVDLSLIIQNTGDGLTQAMKIEPVIMHHGETVYVVLECQVTKIRFDAIANDEAEEGTPPDLARVQILRAGVATIVDEDLVSAVVEMQRVKNEEHAERIAEEKEKAKGIHKLPDVGTIPVNQGATGDPISVSDAAAEVVNELQGNTKSTD